MEKTEKEELRIALDTIRITDDSGRLLNDSAKWAKFISIFGLAMLALTVLTFLVCAIVVPGGDRVATTQMFDQYYTFGYNPSNYTWGAFFVVLIVSAVAALPYIFQYCFAVRVQRAFLQNDTLTMTEAFRSLKSYYVYTGIITILQLVVFLAVFVMALFSMM